MNVGGSDVVVAVCRVVKRDVLVVVSIVVIVIIVVVMLMIVGLLMVVIACAIMAVSVGMPVSGVTAQ